MNIFVVESCPKKAAQSLNDKHVVKMCLETAQLLSTSLWVHGVSPVPYKPTHKSHPCGLWCQATRSNFDWLVEHGKALCAEYTYRYDKIHASEKVVDFCRDHSYLIPAGPLTPFAQAMPEKYKNVDAIEAYRSYYRGEKLGFSTWKRRERPEWLDVDQKVALQLS